MKGFYFDEHMSRDVAKGLQQRGYAVVMAVDVGMEGKDDDTEHLPYAIAHELIMVTLDRPFAGRVSSRTDHPGFVCLSKWVRADIGRMIEILAEFAEMYDPERDKGQVFWLPFPPKD